MPAFYQESNPQPRKHTIWHLTTDFTEGQASMHRRHYVRFPPGTLDRHFEKLLQCDRRLLELNRKGFPSFDSPYFNWTPYEDNTYYYSFNGGGDPSTMEVKPQVQFPAVPPPQWAIQPSLLVEEYSTSSPMSGTYLILSLTYRFTVYSGVSLLLSICTNSDFTYIFLRISRYHNNGLHPH